MGDRFVARLCAPTVGDFARNHNSVAHTTPHNSPSDETLNRGLSECTPTHQAGNTHVKDTVVRVRIRWIMKTRETLKIP